MPFRADARRSGDALILDLSGELDATAEDTLSSAYEEVAAAGNGALIFNFADVDYINSTGLAVVVGMLARARRDGRQVRAIGLSDHYQHIFEITRLSEFMPLYDSEAAAVGAAPATA